MKAFSFAQASTNPMILYGLLVYALSKCVRYCIIIDEEQLKKARISNKDIINFLRGEIQRYTEAIKAKEDTIHQLQKQIEADQSQIAEFQKLIDSLSAKKEDAHE